MAAINSPGVGSGLDINSLIAQIVSAEAEPASVRLGTREARAQAEISALGSLKSVLASFASAVDKIDTLADFQVRKATSANLERFTASASAGAVAGSYQVSVEQLASAHKLASSGVASSDTVLGNGTITLTVNGEAFQVAISSSANTLADVRDAINGAANNTGVGATIVAVDDGLGGTESQLLLTATSTGIANEITVTVDDDDGQDTDLVGLSRLVYDPDGSGVMNLDERNAALDAIIQIDGQSATRASNVLEDVIDGVSLTLVAAEPGVAYSLVVSNDSKGLETKLNSFVGSYNSLLTTIEDLSSFDTRTGQRGILLGDSTLRNVASSLRRELTAGITNPSSPFSTLSEIGIGFDANGRLSLDAGRFAAASAASFDGIGQAFAGSGGAALRLADALEPYVQTNGVIDSRTESLGERLDSIDLQREALDRRLVSLESRLLAQFTAMDAIVSQLQSTSSFLSTQLASLQKLADRSTT